MRFASCLFVGAALLLVVSVAWTSFRHRGASGAAAAAPASIVVSEGSQDGVHRLEAKDAVTRRLLDGEITLLEAAAWFRYINRSTGLLDLVVLPEEEDKSEAERFCRQVIRWADSTALRDASGQAEAVVRRLETELDERLRRDGSVELPELP